MFNNCLRGAVTQNCAVMISHRLAAAEWLWQGAPRIKVAFTPGALTSEKVALAMGLKLILVCHNKAHKDFVEKVGIDHVSEQLKKAGTNTFKIALGDTAQELEALKPPRYVVLEAQKASGGLKRKAEDTPGDAKRKQMADAFERSMTAGPALPKTPSTPKVPVTPVVPPKAPGVPAVTPSPLPNPGTVVPVPGGEEQVAHLQQMLKNFGS